MDGLAASLPRMVGETLGLADFTSIHVKGDRVDVTFSGASLICSPRSDKAIAGSRGVVGCTVASFLAILYSSASKRPVLLEDCVRDEAADTWSVGLNLQPAPKVIS